MLCLISFHFLKLILQNQFHFILARIPPQWDTVFLCPETGGHDGAQVCLLHHYNIITNLSNCKVKFDLKI